MKIPLRDAIDRTFQALSRDRPGVLPFLGAGFSAWPDVSAPRDVDAILGSLPEVVLGNDAMVAAMRATTAFDVNNVVGDAEGAAPSWFLRACLFALLSTGQRRVLENRTDMNLAILSQFVYDEKPGALAHVLDCLYGIKATHKPNSRHGKLSYFPFDVIVTTNYDRCMENALKEVGKTSSVVANDVHLMTNGLRCPVILMIHGILEGRHPPNHAEESARAYVEQVVLTDVHYWDFPKGRDLMTDYLRTLLASRQVIFLGYGLQDFNIIEQLHRLSRHKAGLPHPILLLRESPSLLMERMDSQGIDVCEEDLDTFLEQMNLRSFGVQDLDKLEGVDDRKGAARQTRAAVAAILRTTTGHDGFQNSLREALIWPSFSDRKLRPYNEWQNRSAGFESVGWLRRLDRGNGDISWEFPGDIRFGLCLALNMAPQVGLEFP